MKSVITDKDLSCVSLETSQPAAMAITKEAFTVSTFKPLFALNLNKPTNKSSKIPFCTANDSWEIAVRSSGILALSTG